MSALLTCNKISKSYSSKNLFEDLTFNIQEKEKLGIIGNNGTGKSTLLKILAKVEIPDNGEIIYRKGLKIAYVKQVGDFDSDETVLQRLTKEALSVSHESNSIDAILSVTLGKIGLEDGNILIKNLSGGWKKRLEIACGLVKEPDLLLLDEPTNHLDIEGVLWLEDLLSRANFAWVVISHDRYFLNKTVQRVAEISYQYPDGILMHLGDYDSFLTVRDELFENQARYRESLANKVRREEEWLSRGPKARTTKAKGRIDSALQLQEELKTLSSKLKTSKTSIDFTASGRQSKKLATLIHVKKQLGQKELVNDLSLNITAGMRLGVLGKNGSGKSTLLNLISSRMKPDSGSVEYIDGLKVLYFDQTREHLEPEWTLKRALSETGDNVIFQGRPIHVASWARRFLFTAEHLDKKVSDLSGGERAKVYIARLMLREADLLLLDEPTNDLDISTIEVLEDSLNTFGGAILIVSHDRYTMEQVCDQYLALDQNNKWTIFSDYKQWESNLLQKEKKIKDSALKEQKNTSTVKQKTKLSYKDQREYDQMEEKILELESLLADQQKLAESPDIVSSSIQLQKAYKDVEETQKKLEVMYERWSELESMVNN